MTARAPRVIVCAGGGGVGKTTTSAAIALALARAGRRTLLVTVDPARRLADALGVPLGSVPSIVRIPGEAEIDGLLQALMPDPREALPRIVDLVFEPAQRANVLANPVVELFVDRLAGLHELVCAALVADAVARERPEVVVIDTAPSRHAVDFVQHPARIVELLDGRAVQWLARLASSGRDGAAKGGRLRALGARAVDGALFAAFGAPLVTAVGELFAALAASRGELASLARSASVLLLGPNARYVIVSGPTRAAGDDAAYLARRLRELDLPCVALVLNRARSAAEEFLPLRSRADLAPALREALDGFADEAATRDAAVRERSHALGALDPSMPLIALPDVDDDEPSEIVRSLAGVIGPLLLPHLGLDSPVAARTSTHHDEATSIHPMVIA